MTPLEAVLKICRAKGDRVGMVNGCFDLLHQGHIYLLTEARKHCKVLVVAVNSDASVKTLKGDKRPVNSLMQRYKKLLDTKLPDMIAAFTTETELLELVRLVSPDVMMKGMEYRDKPITGSDHVLQSGGQIIYIPRLNGFSTTNEISKL